MMRNEASLTDSVRNITACKFHYNINSRLHRLITVITRIIIYSRVLKLRLQPVTSSWWNLTHVGFWGCILFNKNEVRLLFQETLDTLDS